MLATTIDLAHAGEGRGAALGDLVIGGVVGVVGLVLLIGLTRALFAGRLPRTARVIDAMERWSGLPRWVGVPVVIGLAVLPLGLFGFNWDVGTHIDAGRDPGPFSNPAHYPVFAALVGTALMGYAAVVFAPTSPTRTSVRVGSRHLPAGALVLVVCGAVAVSGFPLDDAWHRLFGEDVTLWSPTHILMVVGASLAPVGLWLLVVEAREMRRGTHVPARLRRAWNTSECVIAAALLIGLNSMHSEFDYGVPQASLLFHPVLVTLAAGVGLVVARIRLGRGAALLVAVVFLAVRWGTTAVITGAFGLGVEAAPLYLGSALLVEALALVLAPSRRPLLFGALGGLLVGTVGLASEYAFTQVAFLLPWQPSMLLELAVLGPVVGVSAGLLGGYLGRVLVPARATSPRRAVPWSPVVGFAVLVGVFAVLAPTTSPVRGVDLTVTPRAAGTLDVAVRIAPSVVEDAYVFNVLNWQGGEPARSIELVQTGPGTYATAEPVRVDGQWKAVLRLNEGRALQAVALRLPADPGIGAAAVEASTGPAPFVPYKQVMQREALDASSGVQTSGYLVTAGVALLWLVVIGGSLRRADLRLARHAVASARERVPVG